MNAAAHPRVQMSCGGPRVRFGLKGPRAATWLLGHGIAVPAAPNTWHEVSAPGRPATWVARLGSAEFFLEDGPDGAFLREIEPVAQSHPPGVYPVPRGDAVFVLEGPAVHDVLAQVCNINFADLTLGGRPVIMTSMIGVSVLVAPRATDEGRRYRIWCDPTFGEYLGETLEAVVKDSGGIYRGVSE